MDTSIPSAAQLQARLDGLSHSQMQRLASLSGVPFTTLWKIKAGPTTNPGIETVRKFVGLIDAARNDGAVPEPEARAAA